MTKSKSSKRVKGWALVLKKARYGDSEIGDIQQIYLYKRVAMMNRHPDYHKIVPITFSLPNKVTKKKQ